MKYTDLQANNSFEIVARKIKSEEDDDGGDFFWFYVGLHLDRKRNATISFDEIKVVEYQKLDESFEDDPFARAGNAESGFEHRFWLYGFIEASADLVMKNGQILRLKRTRLKWDVTAQEKEKNGAGEFRW
jgi:hypothetical protein